MKKFTLSIFLLLISLITIEAQYIWQGPQITFSKSNNGSPDSLVNQDRITDSVWFTRGTRRGIFNRALENAYVNSFSPEDTEWAFGTLSNWKTLNYQNWEDAVGSNPPGMVNRDMVVHLISDSIYLSLKFSAWAQGAGGLTYTRSTCGSDSTLNVTACGTYTSPSGKTWSKPGTYQDTIPNDYGCDSVMTINLTLSNFKTLKVRACDAYVSPSKKYTYTKTGQYKDTLVGMASCAGADSILTLDVTITPIYRNRDTLTVCDAFTSIAGKTYNSTGVYNDTIRTGICDSIFTYHLTVNKSVTSNINVTSCDRFISPSGNHTWFSSGNFKDTLRTVSGCDSVLNISLTINRSKVESVSRTACNQYTSPSGKNTWSQTGIYRDTLQGVNSCDSILIINLNIIRTTSSSNDIDVCGNSFISPSGKYTWISNGVYKDTILNSVGCDSAITFNLTFRNPSNSSISVTSCKNYISPSRRYTWNTNGTFKDTIQNVYGCDSIITINLTINNADASFDPQGGNLVANSINATSYQWMTCQNGTFLPINGANSSVYTAVQNGDYALEVTENNCIDTSSCISINNVAIQNPTLSNLYLYPNPNNGSFTIKLKNLNAAEAINVFNSQGRLIKMIDLSKMKSAEVKVNLNVSTGIYFLSFTNESGDSIVQRISIE
jgi:hypothetical protein